MMQEQSADQVRSSCTRRRILRATIQLYREIGHRKTTVADIARRGAMSPANVYRFFRSKHEIEEVVVAELLDEVLQAAANAARGGSPVYRLEAVLRTISQLHESRLASDSRLDKLIAAAIDANWPSVLSYVERIVGLLTPIIATGQARGEIRDGNPARLARCLLAALDAHVRAREVSAAAARPTFDEMMNFCINALCLPLSRQGIETYGRSIGQSWSQDGAASPS